MKPCVMWVQIGDKCFYDASNGILRSDTVVHRVEVPMEILDSAGEYTVYTRKLSDGNEKSCTYTFRLGNIWGLVLDCGENKEDENEMYGGKCCSHALRQEQTRFIKQVISCSHEEYQDKTVMHKVIICHYPFSICHYIRGEMYNIEHDIYKEWTDLLNARIKPDITISGHTHHAGIVNKEDEQDLHGMDCPVVIGAEVRKKEPKYFAGVSFEFTQDGIQVEFTEL